MNGRYGLYCKCACGAEFGVNDNGGQNGGLDIGGRNLTAYLEYAKWRDKHEECHLKILDLRPQNTPIA